MIFVSCYLKKLDIMWERLDMSHNSVSNSGGGIGFFGVLGIVFIILKLCKVINWSWLWVLAPIWIPTVIAIFAIVITLILAKFI
jgi:hypothetical protein